jgi:hypothetical protein
MLFESSETSVWKKESSVEQRRSANFAFGYLSTFPGVIASALFQALQD